MTHRLFGTLVGCLLLAAGCGGPPVTADDDTTLRLGYLTNLTHATALVGVRDGYFARALGRAGFRSTTFHAGPDEIEALLSNSVDAAFVGPNPAVNAFVMTHRGAVRLVAGAAEGGAGLVVKPGVTSAADLKGKTVASPELGNTQDVALRYWLKQNGLSTTPTGGGDVHVQPQDNAQTLTAFRTGQVAGAWVPEPWLSRLVLDGGGRVLVDEGTLWPGGRYATAVLLVRTDFLQRHRALVKRLIAGEVAVNRFLEGSPQQAQADANAALKALTTKGLSTEVIESAWRNLRFTEDPLASTIEVSARHAHELGLLPDLPDLRPLFALGPLDEVLASQNLPRVSPP